MEKTIIALLNNNLRVIIPDFGAFIIRQKQPRIVVFNEFLRYNDGLLIDFIAKTEGIEREIAEQRVLDYAEESIKILDSGKVVTIEGLGSLQQDSSGKVYFTEAPEMSSPGPEKAGFTEIEKPKSRRSSKVTGKVIIRKEPEKTEIVFTSDPDMDEVIHELPPTAPVKEEIRQVKENADAPVNLMEVPQSIPLIKERVIPVKKKINHVLVWIIIVLFANAVILAWFVFRDKSNVVSKKNNTVEISDSLYFQLADSVKVAAMDTSIVYQQSPEPVTDKEVSESATIARYYIVAGCFNTEENAEALVMTLRGQGYKAEKFGKIGNLFAVSYASFEDKEKAVTELRQIRETFPDAWMTHF
jgi:nucleoid DNA-binding protein/cell division septation protein DedD